MDTGVFRKRPYLAPRRRFSWKASSSSTPVRASATEALSNCRTPAGWSSGERTLRESIFLSRAGVRTVAACSLYSHKAGDRPPPAITHHHKIIHHNIMNQGIKRSILRWIHIVFGIPIIGYVYSPFEEIPNYSPAVRFVFLPVLLLTGLWMWKGHGLRRLISKRSAAA